MGGPDVPAGADGRLEYDEGADALRCRVCGGWHRNLAQHARLAHGLSADAYRALAGLNRGTRLVSPGVSARLREATAPLIARLRAEGKLRNWGEDPERLARAKARAVEALREGLRPEGRESRRASWTAEGRLSRGERTRERNRAGELGGAPGAIARGLARAAEAAGPRACGRCGEEHRPRVPTQKYCDGCRPEVERQRSRDAARRRRLREREGEGPTPRRTDPLARDPSRDAACGRCGDAFRAASHRERYCPPCRPLRARELGREWRRRRAAGGSDRTGVEVS